MPLGDKITDESLMQQSKSLLVYFINKRGLQVSDRDDVHQEILIALWKARSKYDPKKGKEWKNYSFMVALNAVKDYYREHPRISTKYYRSVDETYHTTSLDQVLYQPKILQDTDYLELTEWLSELTEREQKMIVLSMMGYSLTEISDLLNINERLVYRMMKNLRIKSSRYFSSRPTDTPQNKPV